MPKCPNCGEEIKILDATEAAARLGVSANTFTERTKRRDFPAPWVKVANRQAWLEDDIEREVARELAKKQEPMVKDFERLLGMVDEKTADELVERLEAARAARQPKPAAKSR